MTLPTSWAKARRAHENRAYVRELLWKREPAFAAELATAEQDFPCPACPCRRCSCSTARRGAPTGTSHRPPTKLFCCPNSPTAASPWSRSVRRRPTGRSARRKQGADVQRRHRCRQHLAAHLGVLTAPSAEARATQLQLGLDLTAVNAATTTTVPMPTTVILDADRVRRRIDIRPDYNTRTEPTEVLHALDRIGH